MHLFQAMVAALEIRGHEVVATDLYREGFEPAMRAQERSNYFQSPYDASAVSARLLADFWATVDAVLRERGVIQ